MGFPNGDIKSSANFELNVGKPLDARDKVANYSDLNSISFKYAGMIVFVTSANKHYTLKNDLITWAVLNSGTTGNTPIASSSTAGNGLSVIGNVIELGGNLYHTTTSINLNNKALRFVNGANTLINVDQGLLNSNNNKLSLSYNNRTLNSTAGTLIADWKTSSLRGYWTPSNNADLITKKYLDTRLANLPTASSTAGNGISIINNKIILGGSLEHDTNINVNGTGFTVSSGTNLIADFHNGFLYGIIDSPPYFFNFKTIDFFNSKLLYPEIPDFGFPANNPAIDWFQGRLYDIQQNLSLNWASRTLHGIDGGLSIDFNSRNLQASDAHISLNWDVAVGYDADGDTSINWNNRILSDTAQNDSANWNNRILYDNSEIESIHWNNRILLNNSGNSTLDWGNYILKDSSNIDSVNWNSRAFRDSSNVVSLNWQTKLGFDTNGVQSINWDGRYLADTNIIASIDWRNRHLYNNTGTTVAGWDNDALILYKDTLHGTNALLRFKNDSNEIALEQKVISGWNDIIDNTISENNNIFFKNSSSGYVVGVNLLSTTTDSGATWTNQSLPSSIRLHGGHFVDDNIGFIFGEDNSNTVLVYKTTNGGATWNSPISITGLNFTIPTTVIPQYVYDSNTIYLFGGLSVGTGTRMVKSINGGSNWTVVSNDLSLNFYFSIANHFFNSNTGILVGFSQSFEGMIARTTNGGSTWTYTSFPTIQNFYNVAFKDANNGYVVGVTTSSEGVIVTTTDGGVTWNTPTIIPNTIKIKAIGFASNDIGYFGGVDTNGDGVIYKTYDGGATWDLKHITPTTDFRDLTTTDINSVYAVGATNSANGEITYSHVGGEDMNKLHIQNNSEKGMLGNLALPIENADATNKEYVDGKVEMLQELIDSNITSVTVNQLQTLISLGEIKTTKKYLITNPQDGGQIVVSGNSSSGVNPTATWYYTSNHKAFGLFRISAGSTGLVSSITVNGTQLLSSSISYSTSIFQTITNITANINAFSSTSGYKAYAVNDVCVLEYQTPTTSINGATVLVSTTGTLTTSNITNMRKGANPTKYIFNISYIVANDRILQCKDDNSNFMDYSVSRINTLGYNPITIFRWNDSSYRGNTFLNVNFKPCFIEDPTFGFSANYFDFESVCYSNIALNTSYFYGNKMALAATFINNYILTASTISYNSSFNQAFNATNPLYGISNNSLLTNASGGILYNTLLSSMSYINNNTLLAGTARIRQNVLSGKSANITSNYLSVTSSSIEFNTLSGDSSVISNNTLSNSNAFIRYNTLSGRSAAISTNTISGVSSEITFNTLSGNSNSINTNNISGNSSFIRNNNLIGANANINTNTLNQATTLIENNAFTAINASISSWTSTSTSKVYSNINWTPTEYSFVYTSATLNNTANNGQANSAIYAGIVPNKWYNTSIEWDGIGLTGSSSGAAIQVGLETDNIASGFPNTAITSLTSPVSPSGLVRTKSTSVNRNYVITPNVGITAGTFKIHVSGKIGI